MLANRVVKVTLSAEVAQYSAAMTEAANKTATVGTESEKLAQKKEAFQQLGAGLTVVGGAMTALSIAVMKTGIEYNTLQQKSRAALTTLLGSAEAANAQMDKLDEFARTSPFSKAVFIQAQQQMLAFGIEAKKVVPYLDAIQNAVAAAGGSNDDIAGLVATMSKIQSSAKLTAQDLMEFGNRGVDAAGLIGESMGMTGAQIRSEITSGSLDATAALDALVEGMNTRFAGAADNVKETFAGAMDRVQAAWRDFSSELATPLVDPNGGGALVDLLNWAADMMRAFQELPGPVKTTGAAMFAFAGVVALLAGGALVMTPRVIAIRAAFLALSGTMRGIAVAGGVAVLALAAVAAVIGLVASAQARAQQLADDYAAALDQGADAATQFVAEQLAMKDSFLWMDRGSAVDNAKKLGISLDDVTKAVTGTTEEYEAFKSKVDEAYAAAGKTLDAGYAMEQLKNKVSDLRGAQDLAADQALDTAEATESMSGQLDAAAEASADLEQQTKDANEALDAMSAALDGIAGSAMSMSEAKDAALSAIQDLTSAAKEEGAAIDGTNEASIKLRDSVREVEQSHRDSAQAIIENGGTLADATAEWDKGRESVLKMLESKGMDRAEAIRWADQNLGSAAEVKGGIDDVYQAWLNLPENKETKYKVYMDDALAKLEAVRSKLAQIPSFRSVTLETITIGNRTASPDGNFAGGMYANGMKHFASGGFASGIYAGVMGGIQDRNRIFAEKEMGVPWETYISGRAQDRDRNIGIWQQTGQMLGVGGSGGSSVQAPPVYVQNPFTGEYLLAQVSGVANARVGEYDDSEERISRHRLRG